VYDTHTAQEPGSLFWCHGVLSLEFTHARCLAWGLCPTKFLEHIVICALISGITKNSVIRLKSNVLYPTKFFGSPKCLGWLRYCLQGQVAKLASGLFTVGLYCVIITWQQMFTSRSDIGRFVARGSWAQTSWQVM